jgi:hypothetical protein
MEYIQNWRQLQCSFMSTVNCTSAYEYHENQTREREWVTCWWTLYREFKAQMEQGNFMNIIFCLHIFSYGQLERPCYCE